MLEKTKQRRVLNPQEDSLMPEANALIPGTYLALIYQDSVCSGSERECELK
jgi:hypothetical protein